jgi:hypothetical protein
MLAVALRKTLYGGRLCYKSGRQMVKISLRCRMARHANRGGLIPRLVKSCDHPSTDLEKGAHDSVPHNESAEPLASAASSSYRVGKRERHLRPFLAGRLVSSFALPLRALREIRKEGGL